MKELLINSQIASDLISGIVVSLSQIFISRVEHKDSIKNKKEDERYKDYEWRRNKLSELIENISKLRIPEITEKDEDIIENAYHLINAYFEISKFLFNEEIYKIGINTFFKSLESRYNQMHYIKLSDEKEIIVDDSKKAVICEIEVCKLKLLKMLHESIENIR